MACIDVTPSYLSDPFVALILLCATLQVILAVSSLYGSVPLNDGEVLCSFPSVILRMMFIYLLHDLLDRKIWRLIVEWSGIKLSTLVQLHSISIMPPHK